MAKQDERLWNEVMPPTFKNSNTPTVGPDVPAYLEYYELG